MGCACASTAGGDEIRTDIEKSHMSLINTETQPDTFVQILPLFEIPEGNFEQAKGIIDQFIASLDPETETGCLFYNWTISED